MRLEKSPNTSRGKKKKRKGKFLDREELDLGIRVFEDGGSSAK